VADEQEFFVPGIHQIEPAIPVPIRRRTHAEVMEMLAAAERRRNLGIDPARVIDGETVEPERKEIEGG
jgi:hypothetical protein